MHVIVSKTPNANCCLDLASVIFWKSRFHFYPEARNGSGEASKETGPLTCDLCWRR